MTASVHNSITNPSTQAGIVWTSFLFGKDEPNQCAHFRYNKLFFLHFFLQLLFFTFMAQSLMIMLFAWAKPQRNSYITRKWRKSVNVSESHSSCTSSLQEIHEYKYARTVLSYPTKDDINVPMALSVFRDGDRSPRSGGGEWDLSNHC